MRNKFEEQDKIETDENCIVIPHSAILKYNDFANTPYMGVGVGFSNSTFEK
jgi:hypothetical protein